MDFIFEQNLKKISVFFMEVLDGAALKEIRSEAQEQLLIPKFQLKVADQALKDYVMFNKGKFIPHVAIASLALCMLPALSVSEAHASSSETTPALAHCTPMASPLESFPASSTLYSKVNDEIQCGRSIPTSLLLSARVVNISKFTVRFEGGKLRDPQTRWYIERDYAGHGGSYWKLKSPDSNPTTYSIRADWTIR